VQFLLILGGGLLYFRGPILPVEPWGALKITACHSPAAAVDDSRYSPPPFPSSPDLLDRGGQHARGPVPIGPAWFRSFYNAVRKSFSQNLLFAW